MCVTPPRITPCQSQAWIKSGVAHRRQVQNQSITLFCDFHLDHFAPTLSHNGLGFLEQLRHYCDTPFFRRSRPHWQYLGFTVRTYSPMLERINEGSPPFPQADEESRFLRTAGFKKHQQAAPGIDEQPDAYAELSTTISQYCRHATNG